MLTMLFFIILEQVHRPVRRVIKYAPLLPCHSGTRADLGAEGPTLAQHPVLNVNNTPSLIAYWVSVSLLTPPPIFSLSTTSWRFITVHCWDWSGQEPSPTLSWGWIDSKCHLYLFSTGRPRFKSHLRQKIIKWKMAELGTIQNFHLEFPIHFSLVLY